MGAERDNCRFKTGRASQANERFPFGIYMSTVDVMSNGLEHVLLVGRIDFQKGRGVW